MQATPGDHALAARLAREAGELLVALRPTLDDVDALRAAGDARSNELLLARLAEAQPQDPVLSEESVDDIRRLDSDRVWIVDPLDGTREFGERERTDWAVHVALAVRGEAVAGAVALPARGMVLSTDAPPRLAAPQDGPVRIAVSRSRPPALSTRLAEVLGGVLVPMGSAGAKTMAVVLGDADVYAHGGGQYEWDSAAPVAVAVAAGLHASRLDGSPLRYNRPDPWLPDLLVCRPELAGPVLEAVRAVAAEDAAPDGGGPGR